MRIIVTGPDMLQIKRVDQWVYDVLDNDGKLIFKTTREMLEGVLEIAEGEQATIGRAFPGLLRRQPA